jgi:hypothetical protein
MPLRYCDCKRCDSTAAQRARRDGTKNQGLSEFFDNQYPRYRYCFLSLRQFFPETWAGFGPEKCASSLDGIHPHAGRCRVVTTIHLPPLESSCHRSVRRFISKRGDNFQTLALLKSGGTSFSLKSSQVMRYRMQRLHPCGVQTTRKRATKPELDTIVESRRSADRPLLSFVPPQR